MGYALLFITIPLMIVQNVLTLFPILLVIIVHIMAFGIFEGGFYSLTGTVLGALTCFLLVKYVNFNWVDRLWEKRQDRMERYYRWINEYGVFMIVILRSIPIFPSNLISIAAAFTPIRLRAYLWSCLVGNMSMIWLLSLLSAPLWLHTISNENVYMTMFTGYILFSLVIISFYLRKVFSSSNKGQSSFQKDIS